MTIYKRKRAFVALNVPASDNDMFRLQIVRSNVTRMTNYPHRDLKHYLLPLYQFNGNWEFARKMVKCYLAENKLMWRVISIVK